MNIYIRAQLCTSTAAVASKEGREFLGAKSEKISPSSASEVQTKIIIILNVNANKYVFSKTVDAYDLLRNASHSRKTAPPKIYGLCVINTQQYEYRSCQQNINVHILFVRKLISRIIEHQKTRTQNSSRRCANTSRYKYLKHKAPGMPLSTGYMIKIKQFMPVSDMYIYAHLPKICSSICSLKKSIPLCPKRPNML